MKILMNFILFITFGAAHLSAVLGSDAIKQCYLQSNFAGTKCPDYPALITCLEKIDPEDDMAKNMLENALLTTKSHRDTCKDWKVGCLYDLQNECMEDYHDKKFAKANEVCDEISLARDCLSFINNTCDRDMLYNDLEDLKHHSSLCAEGHFSDGPCSVGAVKNCTSQVIIDRGRDFELGYNCQSSLVVDANSCLSDLKTNCQSQAMQFEVDDKVYDLSYACQLD